MNHPAMHPPNASPETIAKSTAAINLMQASIAVGLGIHPLRAGD
jgi:hypothetical protein